MSERAAGILMPISSLPSEYGIGCFSKSAYDISLEALVEEGVLTKAECEAVDWGKVKGSIDYKKIYEGRYPLLRKAYERSNVHENAEYQKFV